MTSAPSVAAIVPARNEAARIAATVAALRDVAAIGEVIVVDDASDDATSELASVAGARVIRLATRAGKGDALRTGVRATDASVLVFIDGDLGDTASVAATLVAPVLADAADMTIARPPDGAPSGFGLVERFSRWGIKRFTGEDMRRPLSGQRALKREVLAAAGVARRFGVETALTIDALHAGYRVLEVPYPIEHARTGRDLRGFVHRARQGRDVALVLLSRAFRRPAG